jgi:hypothetical protein
VLVTRLLRGVLISVVLATLAAFLAVSIALTHERRESEATVLDVKSFASPGQGPRVGYV